MPLLKDGVLSREELGALKGMPSGERLAAGPVVVIECGQQIPCDPCEGACPQGAIRIGEPIINLPELEEGKCTGCGLCIAACPGQAIFVVDMTYGEGKATVQLPYEFLPLPEKGELVGGLNRAGEEVCEGQVLRVVNSKKLDRTPVVTVIVPRDCGTEVRSIRLRRNS